MFGSAVSITLVLSSLLGFSTHASALCLACPNCIYDPLPNGAGNACLNYWTCSGDTITCYYPSVEYPGTFTACAFTGSGSVSLRMTGTVYADAEFDLDSKEFTLTASSPSVCDDSYIGDNSKCEPSNDPWNAVAEECTASEAYVETSPPPGLPQLPPLWEPVRNYYLQRDPMFHLGQGKVCEAERPRHLNTKAPSFPRSACCYSCVSISDYFSAFFANGNPGAGFHKTSKWCPFRKILCKTLGF
ncbi:hypothetical protein JVU11DRAFT_10016 [Chiua virens]|nr:hypothetical protein JVU11DRAFT_10016 [Chiua virens]